MRSRWQKFADWVAGIEPIRAAIVGILATAFIAGATYKGIDNRIDNNASDIRVEAKARNDADEAITKRIDRGFDKILGRLDGMQGSLNDKAKADAETAKELGYLRGLYERNYGTIPKGQR